MKKFLSLMMAVVASLSVLAFATACEDGKCDECGSNKNVKYYELNTGDDRAEYCTSCAIANALKIEGEVEK
ncbi:MAG: hypothetical protein IJX98_03235 [Clostridia bacterium]|nr:hypothetical protein [Clostridia bacterium]